MRSNDPLLGASPRPGQTVSYQVDVFDPECFNPFDNDLRNRFIYEENNRTHGFIKEG